MTDHGHARHLSLSYDHRVINGGDGGRFFTQLVALLGDIRRLLL